MKRTNLIHKCDIQNYRSIISNSKASNYYCISQLTQPKIKISLFERYEKQLPTHILRIFYNNELE